MATVPGPADPALESRKLDIEDRKVAIDEGKLALDNSFAKKWGGIVIPAVVALAGTLITGFITISSSVSQYYQSKSVAAEQINETARKLIETEHQAAIDNSRLAATLYFDKLADLRNNDNRTPAEQRRFLNELKMIQVLSDDPKFQKVLLDEASTTSTNALNSTENFVNGLQTKPPAVATQDLPDLVPDQSQQHPYTASEFLAFPQAPGTNSPTEKPLVDALTALGFKVQTTQHMAPGFSPKNNEVRYYRGDQQQFASWISEQLSNKYHLPFTPKAINRPGLPNGILEFWIGSEK